MNLRLRLFFLISCLLVSAFAEAKEVAINNNPLKAEIRETQILVSPGMENDLSIHLNLADGYHAYLERFKLVSKDPAEIKVTDFDLSPVVKFYDPVSKSQKAGVKDESTLSAKIMVPKDFGNGVTPLVLALTYQACREEHCLFPKTIEVKTQLNTSGVKGALVTQQKSETKESMFNAAVEKGFLGALLLAFLFGLGTSLTPCIYPMIPITLAVLGARKKEQSHFKGFLLALVYVLGIALTYSVLGVIAASTGSAFGRLLGNIYTVSGIAVVFVLMGISMYGLINIQMPQFIQTRLGFAHKSAGFLSAFSAGLAAGVVASPCVGPVLISILTYIAQTQNKVFGFFFLFTFAFGIGIPFLILGTFSQLVSKIPKAGAWMEFVKFAFGTVMIGMAFFYLEPVYPQWLFNLLLGLALIFIASLYGAFDPISKMPVDPETPITKGALARVRKGLMIALLLTGAALFAHSVLARAGVSFAGKSEVGAAGAVSEKKSGVEFEKFSMEKLYIAQKEHKPVMIDFFAEWCAACKELEEKTFPQARFQELGKEFVLMRFDATEDDTAVNTILKEFNVIGLPTLLFFDRSGQQRDDERVTGFETAEVLTKRMEKILQVK